MNIALAILSTLFLVQIICKKAPARQGLFGILALLFSIAIIFGTAIYQSWQQYLAWQSNDLSRLLLPPHQSWDYFVFYSRIRFFNSYFLSLAIGLGFLIAAKYLNKKYQERFFEPVEPYLLATAIFVVGHPLWLFYLIILLTISLISSLVISYWSLSQRRLPLYYFWLPAAIFTIIISEWLSTLPWWQTLKF